MGTQATASGTYPNVDLHKLEHINDGIYGNAKSWISNEVGRGWVQLEFAEPHMIDELRWSRDRAIPPQYADRVATQYRIETSLDGVTWTAVASNVDRLPFGMSVPGGRLIRVDGRGGSEPIRRVAVASKDTRQRTRTTQRTAESLCRAVRHAGSDVSAFSRRCHPTRRDRGTGGALRIGACRLIASEYARSPAASGSS